MHAHSPCTVTDLAKSEVLLSPPLPVKLYTHGTSSPFPPSSKIVQKYWENSLGMWQTIVVTAAGRDCHRITGTAKRSCLLPLSCFTARVADKRRPDGFEHMMASKNTLGWPGNYALFTWIQRLYLPSLLVALLP